MEEFESRAEALQKMMLRWGVAARGSIKGCSEKEILELYQINKCLRQIEHQE